MRRARMTASQVALWTPDKMAHRIGFRSTARLTLPDFLGLGAQKAGSTWLWANLRCHPSVFLSAKKELHYFNQHFYKSLSSYAAHFCDGEARVKGEITPAYGILPPRTIRFLRQIMPNVKLLLVLRNPIDRAWSRAKMYLREPGQSRIEFTKYTNHEIHRALAHSSSRARGDYLTIIDNWLRFFPRQQLYIGYYDDLAQDPKEFLEGIFDFLGVPSNVDWNLFPFARNPNPTPPIPIPHEYRQLLTKLYADQIEALYQRLGEKVRGWRCV
jgi:hypothetical protein